MQGIERKHILEIVTKYIAVKNKAHLFNLDKEVFSLLFNHTIARRNRKFDLALETNVIKIEDFISLSRSAEVPYPLFFLDKPSIESIIHDYEKKVYFGVSKDQISIATRGDIALADISLVIKDITRKQGYLRKVITDESAIPGMLMKSKASIVEKVTQVSGLVGFMQEDIEQLSKEKTYNYLSGLLSKLNIFVSLYTDHYTPQRIDKSLKFSGIAIYDKKCPFLFIKAGDSDSAIEPWGRRTFTLALLLSALCHGDYGPVSLEGKSRDLTELSDRHFIFAEEFLMPKAIFESEIIDSRSDVDRLSTKYSVSPSAIVMRAFRLGVIDDEEVKDAYLDDLQQEWNKAISERGGGNPIGFEKAIHRYNNPAVVRMILETYRQQGLTSEAAKNLLCYKKGEKVSLTTLEAYGK